MERFVPQLFARGCLKQPLVVGDWISDRYQVQALLSHRAATCTYLALAQPSQTSVIVKSLAFEQLESWQLFECFEREIAVLAQLEHPAIPRYIEHFEQPASGGSASVFYLVQSYVPGPSLEALVAQGMIFSESAVRAIARQVLEILAYLHGCNPAVVHRDLKPANLVCEGLGVADAFTPSSQGVAPIENPVLTFESDTPSRIHLVDFGAVQGLNKSSTDVVGTYGYMAPEQFRGQACPASDLYGLGVTLIYLLSHCDPVALPSQGLAIDFRPCITVSEGFAQWLEGLLAPIAGDRFESAQVALTALADSEESTWQRSSVKSCEIAVATKPPESRIRLERDRSRLFLEIPPLGLQRELWALAGFALLWNGGLLFWLMMTWLMGTPWGYGLLSLPLWAVGLGGNLLLARPLFGRVRLVVEGERFCLEQWLGPHCRVRHGSRQDLKGVVMNLNELEVGIVQGSQVWLQLDLESVLLGEMRSPAEQRWLSAELKQFLAGMR